MIYYIELFVNYNHVSTHSVWFPTHIEHKAIYNIFSLGSILAITIISVSIRDHSYDIYVRIVVWAMDNHIFFPNYSIAIMVFSKRDTITLVGQNYLVNYSDITSVVS